MDTYYVRKMCAKVVLLVGVLLACSLAVSGEVFTALVHMEGLVSAERQLVESLNMYINQERKRQDRPDHVPV